VGAGLQPAAPQAEPPAPQAVVLGTEAKAFEEAAARAGWSVLRLPEAGPNDATAKAARSAVKGGPAYLVGVGAAAAAVFYLAARVPDLWAAALAIEGSPKAAIDTGRLFADNTQLTPVLWVTSSEEAPAMPGYHLERRTPAEVTAGQALEWLARHRRDEFPPKVDCETGNPELARCYWVEITRLDFARRNDVLGTSRLKPGSGAALALGGFGFDLSAAGPGVLVSWLPDNYQGPLKLGDRIVSVAGKGLADAQAYLEYMSQVKEEKPVVVMVQRGRERQRVETRIVLPKRDELLTARVRAEFLSDARELLIISRGAAELRLTLPRYWVPCPVNWNGTAAGTADAPGCWAATEGGQLRRCE